MMDEETQLLTTLLTKLDSNASKLRSDIDYYDANARPKSIGVSTPPEMRDLLAQIGWSRMYVDSIEERLDVEGFRLASEPQADERLWEWWQTNNLDEQSGLGHTDALIHGRSFITVSQADATDSSMDPDIPVIRVESPNNFYADFDPITRKVTQAVRSYSDDDGTTVGATLLLPNATRLYRWGNFGWVLEQSVDHNLNRVPAVPLLNRELLSQRNGASEITPEIRSATDAACRIMMDMQGAAELMAIPQRVLFGVARNELPADEEGRAALEAYYARIMAFEDPTGKAVQFNAAELRNFTEVLDQLAKQVASYTGLPPQYLSFANDNPASAEAIRSAESRLVKKCERKQRMFGAAWEEALRLGMLLIDGTVREGANRMETIWRDPATPTYAAKADAATKLYNNGMGVIPLERARIDMGYSPEERLEMRHWDEETPTNQLAALMATPAPKEPSPDTQGSKGDDAARPGTNVVGNSTTTNDGYGRPSRNGNK